MNCVDSELEEGEILDEDDSLLFRTVYDKKDKELPRRYVVNDKSSPHKHKKKYCKHAIRNQAKKLSKLKSPVKMKYPHKSHKSSCYEKKSHKYSDNHNSSSISKKCNSFSKQSLISEIKSSCKDTFCKQSTKPNKFDLQNANNFTNDFNASKVQGVKNLKSPEVDKQNNFLGNLVSGSADHNKVSTESASDLLNTLNSKTECPVKSDASSSNPSEVANEESEDEEELRRIALATCAKRKPVVESSEKSIQSIEICNTLVPDAACINDGQIIIQTSNPVSDNYEVVDMDVDDDDQGSVEVIETPVNSQECEHSASLFVIDTNPSTDFLGNKENSPSELQSANNSDDDFEADILRAELIEKMTRRQYSENKPIQKPVNVLLNTKPNQKPTAVLPEKKFVKHQKLAKTSAVNFLHKPLRSHKRILRKNVINKSVTLLQSNNNKSVAPVPINKPTERLVIALNEESSSSEDSDNADECSSVPENPVDSIVALISDCRQNSNSTEKTKETVEHVPKAVSCLSKGQQAEYNLYMKILAGKNKLPTNQNTLLQKNGSIQSPSDKLKQMKEDLAKMKDTLKHKKELVTSLARASNTKRLNYLKAKLAAHHLREQFAAAEKVRKTKLMEWSKAADRWKFMRQYVSDLEKQINKVEILCSENGPSKQGHSNNLPLLPQNNKQS